MTSVNRYQKTSKTLQKVLRCCIYIGIAVGFILGVPAFTAASDDLLGSSINQIETLLSDNAVLLKYISIAIWIIGASGIWKGSLPKVTKYVIMGLCAAMILNIYGVPANDIASYIYRSILPVIGFAFWALANALQIFMLTLKNDPDAVKKLLGKINNKSESTPHGDETTLEIELKDYLSKNKVSNALSFFMIAGSVAYIAEFLVNIKYSPALSGISNFLMPGGLIGGFFQALSYLVVLGISIGSIELCVKGLQHLDEIKEVTD